jgi:pyridoxamine 5'-phosphate oxidase
MTIPELHESAVDRNPFQQFGKWFSLMEQAGVTDVNAMTLATATHDGHPSCRVVLLKDFTAEGFSFYTNYGSRKAKEIADNPRACLNFFWKEYALQVRIEGALKKTDAQQSDNYFKTRPRGSQVGAWASPQSAVIDDRGKLEKLLAQATVDFEGKEVSRPEWWGGYILVPEYFEFWLGRADRLHDRITYTKKDNSWVMKRLAP